MKHARILLSIGDDFMGAIRFWKIAKGNLPHLSYILRKTEPLWTGFNTVACSVTGALMLIEVQRRKEGMNQRNYQKYFGATSACTKRMMEATKRIGQKSIKGGTKDYFLFDSWYPPRRRQKLRW